jgi:formylglycine-generating enzyme required for sulfatase activity
MSINKIDYKNKSEQWENNQILNNSNKPREYDAVLGGNDLPSIPANSAVLGGIEGVEKRLKSPRKDVKIAAIKDAFRYGQKGLGVVKKTLANLSIEEKFTIYRRLKIQIKPGFNQILNQVFSINEFDVITVDNQGRKLSRVCHSAYVFVEKLGEDINLEMVYIPGGKFLMGSPSNEGSHYERPLHEVTISPFYMAKYPITQRQYEIVMKSNPSWFKGMSLPVENVSWYDAVNFCQLLSRKTDKYYRLPSEAEWEYACRAGTITPFNCGDTITPDLVNYAADPYQHPAREIKEKKTTDVGIFPPNSFGLYDMHGNVWEWCQDVWHDNYLYAPTDGKPWEIGKNASYRVRRGGSWVNDAIECRSAHRGRHDAMARRGRFGFRVAFS